MSVCFIESGVSYSNTISPSPSPCPFPLHPPHAPSPFTLPVPLPPSPSPCPIPLHPPRAPFPFTLPVPLPPSPSPCPFPLHPPRAPSPFTLPVPLPPSPSPCPIPLHPPRAPSPFTLPVPLSPAHKRTQNIFVPSHWVICEFIGPSDRVFGHFPCVWVGHFFTFPGAHPYHFLGQEPPLPRDFMTNPHIYIYILQGLRSPREALHSLFISLGSLVT